MHGYDIIFDQQQFRIGFAVSNCNEDKENNFKNFRKINKNLNENRNFYNDNYDQAENMTFNTTEIEDFTKLTWFEEINDRIDFQASLILVILIAGSLILSTIYIQTNFNNKN